jgi:hypothetical protein
MLKLMLVMLFHRLLRGMKFGEDVKHLRAIGHAAHAMTEAVSNNVILFLILFSSQFSPVHMVARTDRD